jgi:pimeloyl-ACP methyl ester carboxylesterase
MSILDAAAAVFDRAVVIAARAQNGRSRAESLSHDDRMKALASIRDAYANVEDFFPAPAPIAPSLARVRTMRHVAVLDASWPSEFETYLADIREKYASHVANRTAYARLFVAPKPRRAIVLIHGYMAGQWAIEERAWPIAWLTERYDVALAVLPFHAVRAERNRRGPPPFPGPDPRVTNEGFRQSMMDLRSLVRFLRARGAPSVGVMGMSLGGYSAALLATVERDLAFAAPIIPLASLADFARDQGRLGEGPRADVQHAALEEAYRIVSPLARPSLVPSERVLVVAAHGDRITPISHAERLAAHFGARVVRFEGGHLLQFGRGEAFRTIGRFIASLP